MSDETRNDDEEEYDPHTQSITGNFQFLDNDDEHVAGFSVELDHIPKIGEDIHFGWSDKKYCGTVLDVSWFLRFHMGRTGFHAVIITVRSMDRCDCNVLD